MKPDTQALLDGAASEHGLPDVDAWIDSAVSAIQQQERELEMMTEALRIASTAVESLHLECDRHRQAANEHRNAAMEADLRTQAAVRGENLVRDMMQKIISIAHDGSLEKGDRLQRIAVRAAKILCANPETPNGEVRSARHGVLDED